MTRIHQTHRTVRTSSIQALLGGAAVLALCTAPLLSAGACSPTGNGAAASTESHSGEGAEEPTKLDAAEDRVGDAILHFEVKAKLLEALHWDAIGIEVNSLDGRILLSGEAPDRATLELAEEIARSVEGVQQVESQLVLEQDDAPERTRGEKVDDAVSEAEREVSDALLEARLKARLLQEIGRHALDVEVEAASGVVTLRGHLASEAHEQIALETASRTEGVEEVINLIET